MLVHLACYVPYRGCFLELYACGSWWVVMVVGLVSGALRDEIGLRGPLHSAEKLVDHLGATHFVVGHTHSSYRERLQGALMLLGAQRAITVRGMEGADILRTGRPSASDTQGPIELPETPGSLLRGDPDPQLAAAGERLGRGLVKDAVQQVQQRIRDGEVAPPDAVDAVLASLPVTAGSLRPVLNATGVIVHTNLGRAPLSAAAVEALVAASGTTDTSPRRARNAPSATAVSAGTGGKTFSSAESAISTR